MMIPSLVTFVASMIFTATVIYAGVSDLTTMKIRNGLILTLVVSYFILAPVSGLGTAALCSSVLTALVVLTCTFSLFQLGYIGGGDAKLIAAAALWLGAEHTVAFLIYTALFGGVLTLTLLQFRSMVLPTSCLNISWMMRLHTRGSGVPYGVAIAGAALFVLPHTHWSPTLL